MLVCEIGSFNVVEVLIKKGVDLNFVDIFGYNVLYYFKFLENVGI